MYSRFDYQDAYMETLKERFDANHRVDMIKKGDFAYDGCGNRYMVVEASENVEDLEDKDSDPDALQTVKDTTAPGAVWVATITETGEMKVLPVKDYNLTYGVDIVSKAQNLASPIMAAYSSIVNGEEDENQEDAENTVKSEEGEGSAEEPAATEPASMVEPVTSAVPAVPVGDASADVPAPAPEENITPEMAPAASTVTDVPPSAAAETVQTPADTVGAQATNEEEDEEEDEGEEVEENWDSDETYYEDLNENQKCMMERFLKAFKAKKMYKLKKDALPIHPDVARSLVVGADELYGPEKIEEACDHLTKMMM